MKVYNYRDRVRQNVDYVRNPVNSNKNNQAAISRHVLGFTQNNGVVKGMTHHGICILSECIPQSQQDGTFTLYNI